MLPALLRIVGLALLAPSLVFAEGASAQGDAPVQPPPQFDVHPPKPERDAPSTWVSATVDGCWEEGYSSELSEYSIDDYSCVTAELALWQGRRLLTWRAPFFFDPDHGTSAAGASVEWSCRGPRRYRYRVTYTNDSYKPDGRPYTAVKRGTFTIPRCRKPLIRKVGRGVASARAYKDNQAHYEGEFISSVRCRPSSAPRGGKAGKWTCQTTHNNSYRECVDTDVLTFTRVDKWGRRDKSYKLKTVGKRCRYF